MKHLIIFSLIFSLLVAPVAVFGEEDTASVDDTSTTSPETSLSPTSKKPHPVQILEQKRTDAVQKRIDAVGQVKDKRIELQNKMQDKRADLASTTDQKKDELREKAQERKAKLKDRAKERIKGFFARLVRRIDAAFNRLAELIERIESRIAKLEEVNKNIQTDEAKKFLALAKEDLREGKDFLAQVKALADDVVTDESETEDTNPRTKYEEAKKLIRAAIGELHSARENIKNAVRSIKAQVDTNTDDSDTSETDSDSDTSSDGTDDDSDDDDEGSIDENSNQ
tara:strand:- start:8397 stop:9242 length:846 start_codon:yes stop_codon:yes gene_type:complete